MSLLTVPRLLHGMIIIRTACIHFVSYGNGPLFLQLRAFWHGVVLGWPLSFFPVCIPKDCRMMRPRVRSNHSFTTKNPLFSSLHLPQCPRHTHSSILFPPPFGCTSLSQWKKSTFVSERQGHSRGGVPAAAALSAVPRLWYCFHAALRGTGPRVT